MAINVKLPEALVESAKRYGNIKHRSVPKQIEYWSQIGKIAAENPDLSFFRDPRDPHCRPGRACGRVSIWLMRILVTPTFQRAVKKLHTQQKAALDEAVRTISNQPGGRRHQGR